MINISPYLTIPLITVVISQIIKFAYHAFSNEIDFKQLVKVGGTPSTLVAAIVSVAFTSIAVDGIDTSVAGVTVVLSLILIYVVYSGAVLKAKLNSDSEAVSGLPDIGRKDMAFGALTGFVSGVLFSVNYWKDDLSWFFDRPSDGEMLFQFISFGALFVIAEVLAFLTRRKDMRKLPTSRKLNRAFRLSLTAPAIVGILITFAQRETLGMFDSRIWTYVIYDWIIIGSIWAWWSVYRRAGAHLKEEREHFKKSKSRTKTKAKKKSAKKKKRR